MPPEQQAERRHQHHRADTRVGLGAKLTAVGYQYAVGLAGPGVVRAFQAVLAQTLQVRCAPDKINAVSPPAE